MGNHSLGYLPLSLVLLFTLPGCAGSCLGDAAAGPDESAIVGTWKCSTSLTDEGDGLTQKMQLESEDEYLENKKGNSQGTLRWQMVQPGLRGTWNAWATFEYEFTQGKLCTTITDIKLTPGNDKSTREFESFLEKATGKSLADNFPKGVAECSAYTLSENKLTTESRDGALTTCTR